MVGWIQGLLGYWITRSQEWIVLHFINSNIRVLNVQRTNPMRIAFTVLANTELSSIRVTKLKSPVNPNVYQLLQKRKRCGKTQNKIKCTTTLSRLRGWPSVDVVLFVYVCIFCIYYIHRSYTKGTEVLIDILNRNIKSFKSHKVQIFHFYGNNTSQVKVPVYYV